MIVDKNLKLAKWGVAKFVVPERNFENLVFFSYLLLHGIGLGEDTGISLNDRNVLIIGFLSGKNDRV